ncbi:MAG: hypothetical protein WCL14_10960 [Bacteroidota bacterium]
MKTRGFWVSFCLINLCVVALLGVILRSKMLFELPSIDYNHLLKVHSNFAFGAWVSLALMVLFTKDILTEVQRDKNIYRIIFWGIFACCWGLVLTLPFAKYANYISYISTTFIFITYLFFFVFINDVRKTSASKTTKVLAISALSYLVLSSAGTFMLAYLFATKSLNAVLYRDALFSYLHLMYNGFFTLGVFSLLFHRLESKLSVSANKNIFNFSVLLSISVIPSMFLSYHWHDPSNFIHAVAYLGSILLLLSLALFIRFLVVMAKPFKHVSRILKFVGFLSIGSFVLKMFLQSFTIFNVIGNPIFGDRPMIMGFLHLVFLGFVTLFLLAYFTQTGILNLKLPITKIALGIFTMGIIINLALLFIQGIGALFMKSNANLPWMLWGAGLWLFIGAFLVNIARLSSIISYNKAKILPKST